MYICPGSSGVTDPRINPAAEPGLTEKIVCGKVLVCVAGDDTLKDRGVMYYELFKNSGWNGEVEIVESKGLKWRNEKGKDNDNAKEYNDYSISYNVAWYWSSHGLALSNSATSHIEARLVGPGLWIVVFPYPAPAGLGIVVLVVVVVDCGVIRKSVKAKKLIKQKE
ncbi:2-hydroxyisoflavanone dehydratase-like protein [Tanacetum coccineum]